MYELDDLEQTEGCIFTIQDLKDLAKSYLTMFFKNKVDGDGNEIELEDLLTDRNVSLVLNLDIGTGMPLFYSAVKTIYKKEMKRKGKVPPDVECALGLLAECSKMSIPKPFAAGLLTVYAEMCKGCKIDI